MSLKFNTISQIGSYTLYWYECEDGSVLFNYKSNHPMGFANENLSSVVYRYHTSVCEEKFNDIKKLKSWKDAFKRKNQICNTVSDMIYRDLQRADPTIS